MPLALTGTTLPATTSRQGPTVLAADGDVSANVAVQGSDSRLGVAATTGVSSGDLVFGTGEDGNLDLNGSAVTGMSLTGSEYRCSQIINSNNLTIRAGYWLNPNGWPIFCRNTLTMENGTYVANDGGNASGTTAGTGALPATAPTSTSAPFYGGSTGGAGRVSTATGSFPTTPTGLRLGGAGWPSQTAPSGGGATGTAGVSSSDVGTAYARYNGDPARLLISVMRLINGTALTYACGAAGGSAGAWSHTSGGSGTSGAGGGGGGVLVLAARELVTSGTGHRFSVNGGAGSNATMTAGTNAASGGGQGGPGGYALIQIGQVVSGSPPPAEARGGAAGNGAQFGYVSSAGNGGNGGNGGAINYVIGTYSGAAPANTAAGGAAGTGSANGVSGTAGATGTVNYPGGYT